MVYNIIHNVQYRGINLFMWKVQVSSMLPRLYQSTAIGRRRFILGKVFDSANYSTSKLLAAKSKDQNEVDIVKDQTTFQRIIQKFPFKSTQTIVGGSIILAVGVSKVLYSITSSFLALTPAGSLYYGFMGGMVTMGMAAGFSYVGERSFRLNPNHAIRSAMQIISKHKDVQEHLGSSLTIGPIKTYKSVASSIGVVNGKPGWISPILDVVFQLHSRNKDAIVSVVYTKKGLLQEKCEFIEVEINDPNDGKKTLTLVGENSHFTVRNEIKRHAAALSKKY